MPTPSPSRALSDSFAALDTLHNQMKAFRVGLSAINLPLSAANDRLDHSDDLAAILESQLLRAWSIVNDEIERIEAANAREARAVDRDFQRWNVAVGITKRVVANDDAPSALVEMTATLEEMNRHYDERAAVYAKALRDGT